MRLRVSAILTLLTLAVLGAGAQQPPPTPLPPGAQIDTPIFRSTVDAIELDAFVVDAQGNPVTNLTVNDFEILEEGRRQEITAFTAVNIPIETTVRPVASTAVPDVRTNEQPEGRIYLFAVDEIPGRLVAATSSPPPGVRRAKFRRRRHRGDCVCRSRAIHRRTGFHERPRGAAPLH